MTETAKSAYLTPDAFDRLKGELEHLSTEGRVELSKKIEAARLEGDLRENGGYHAAKEEQGKMAGRILHLAKLIENAEIVNAGALESMPTLKVGRTPRRSSG